MNNNILSNKDWKESDYGNPLNTTTDSFFKAHDERNIKEGNELRQIKHKGDNRNDEKPIKRDLAAKKSMKLVKYQSSGILCVIVVMLEYRRIYNTHPCSQTQIGESIE
ncbi:hypothetical protein Tco_0848565 [Tanacetum coccineum]